MSGVFSGVGESAQGEGGDIRLITRNFELLNGGQIRTSTFGIGVDINATGRLASGNILLPDVSFIQNTLT